MLCCSLFAAVVDLCCSGGSGGSGGEMLVVQLGSLSLQEFVQAEIPSGTEWYPGVRSWFIMVYSPSSIVLSTTAGTYPNLTYLTGGVLFCSMCF